MVKLLIKSNLFYLKGVSRNRFGPLLIALLFQQILPVKSWCCSCRHRSTAICSCRTCCIGNVHVHE